jgi:peptide chain release factor 1
MKDSLRQQLERLTMRLAELDANLSDGGVVSDIKRYRALSREQAEVAQLVGLFSRYQQREADVAAAREMLSDPELAEMAREEIAAASADLERLSAELQAALLPRDPDDELRRRPGAHVPALLRKARLAHRGHERERRRTRRLQGTRSAHRR